jgi:hypothetical protein
VRGYRGDRNTAVEVLVFMVVSRALTILTMPSFARGFGCAAPYPLQTPAKINNIAITPRTTASLACTDHLPAIGSSLAIPASAILACTDYTARGQIRSRLSHPRLSRGQVEIPRVAAQIKTK